MQTPTAELEAQNPSRPQGGRSRAPGGIKLETHSPKPEAAATTEPETWNLKPGTLGPSQPETRNPKPETPRRPGRPSLSTSSQRRLLTALIGQTGRSDSAAALALGISTSTISRWKQERPELAELLRQAREEFRQRQLDIIRDAAAAGPSGWRAAAWLLERVFPQDYAPRAAEREKFQRLSETNAAETEPEPSVHPESAPIIPEIPISQPAPRASAPEPPSQNSQNPPASTPPALSLTTAGASFLPTTRTDSIANDIARTHRSPIHHPKHPSPLATQILA